MLLERMCVERLIFWYVVVMVWRVLGVLQYLRYLHIHQSYLLDYKNPNMFCLRHAFVIVWQVIYGHISLIPVTRPKIILLGMQSVRVILCFGKDCFVSGIFNLCGIVNSLHNYVIQNNNLDLLSRLCLILVSFEFCKMY